MKNSTKLIILISIVLPLCGMALIVGGAVREGSSYPTWYSTDPSIVAIDQKLGTMTAIYKGSASVCEQFTTSKKQCFMVTIK